MQIRDLQGLTSLPFEHVQHRFRNEDVIAVLPTRAPGGQDSILVATSPKVAVVVGVEPDDAHWMTFWAPWDSVRIDDDAATEDGWYGLTVSIGHRTFEARLPGPEGQRSLREFVVAIQARQTAIATD